MFEPTLCCASQRSALHGARLRKTLEMQPKRVKEGLKKMSHWAAYYFTNPKSWYPVPEPVTFLSATPVMQPLTPVPMAPQCMQSMRDWAQMFHAAVRQHSVRQETKMARAGNPSYLYHREVQPGESVSLEHSEEHQGNGGRETEDSVLEYNSPIVGKNQRKRHSSDNNESDDVSGEIPLLDGEANFLLGTVSQFIRSIRFNNRILF